MLMRSMVTIRLTLAGILLLGAASLLLPSPRSHISMNLVDRSDNTTPDGVRTVFNLVEVDGVDSLLFRQYATTMYHALVPDSVSASMPVQVITYFYQPDHVQELDRVRRFQMSGGDRAKDELFKKLGTDSLGYYAVRFSDIYRIMQRDTLYVGQAEVLVPRSGARLQDFVSPPSSRD